VAVADQKRAAVADETGATARGAGSNGSAVNVGFEANLWRPAATRQMKLTPQQLEAHLWGAANMLSIDAAD
jgi:hypothetical protein